MFGQLRNLNRNAKCSGSSSQVVTALSDSQFTLPWLRCLVDPRYVIGPSATIKYKSTHRIEYSALHATS